MVMISIYFIAKHLLEFYSQKEIKDSILTLFKWRVCILIKIFFKNSIIKLYQSSESLRPTLENG